MPRRPRRRPSARAWRALCVAALVGAPAGCRDRVFVAPVDAGDDAGAFDAPPPGDGPYAPLALDFTATGCPQLDLTGERCLGTAPLALGFAPVSSVTLDQLRWDFGDGTPPSSARAPQHTYTLPGTYDVALAANGPTGSVSRTRRGYVVAMAAPVGGTCDVDGQCALGLSCLCGAADDCPPAFARGLCSMTCRDGACPGTAVCADLSAGVAVAADGGAPAAGAWQQPSCLAPCTTDADCGGDLRCRDLPGRAAGDGDGGVSRWVKGCFAPYPLDVGGACRGGDGAPQGAACASGLCADLGASGLCTATCGSAGGTCPPGSDCALFGDGRTLCLEACRAAGDCTRDPLLACVAPGAAGALGFTITGGVDGGAGAAATTYCAPRPCASAADCEPAGRCTGAAAGGHCTWPG
jgi:PKD repeat protein